MTGRETGATFSVTGEKCRLAGSTGFAQVMRLRATGHEEMKPVDRMTYPGIYCL